MIIFLVLYLIIAYCVGLLICAIREEPVQYLFPNIAISLLFPLFIVFILHHYMITSLKQTNFVLLLRKKLNTYSWWHNF